MPTRSRPRYKILQEFPSRCSNRSHSDRARAIVERALAKPRDERYQHMSEMLLISRVSAAARGLTRCGRLARADRTAPHLRSGIPSHTADTVASSRHAATGHRCADTDADTACPHRRVRRHHRASDRICCQPSRCSRWPSPPRRCGCRHIRLRISRRHRHQSRRPRRQDHRSPT
jgi:hypothetical protein